MTFLWGSCTSRPDIPDRGSVGLQKIWRERYKEKIRGRYSTR